MPKNKPAGWPRYMSAKQSKAVTSYYWSAPSWARQRSDCPIKSEALGSDYGAAKRRCDDVLNPIFDSWRTGGATDDAVKRRVVVGSIDWIFATFKKSPKFPKSARSASSYDYALGLIADYRLKDGRRFGSLMAQSVQPGNADLLYERLKISKDGTTRERAAALSMVVAKRAWDVARRSYPTSVPSLNPFAKMDLTYRAKLTRAATREELERFVTAADAAGRPSLATAAMVAFYWLQREEDIFLRLAWADYRPAAEPDHVLVWHHKNHGARIRLPLFDVDGTALWPELTARIDATPKLGPILLMRETPDRKKKIHLPWQTGGKNPMRHVQGEVRRICRAAGLDEAITFTSFRHGGHTDGADAELTDAQMRALGGHKTTAALIRYAKETERQQQTGARKRLNARTKREDLSE